MKTWIFAAAAAAGMATPALAQDEVRLQLQWVTQAQFAGYYVALENGFYDEENLDVTILPVAQTSPRRRYSPVAARM